MTSDPTTFEALKAILGKLSSLEDDVRTNFDGLSRKVDSQSRRADARLGALEASVRLAQVEIQVLSERMREEQENYRRKRRRMNSDPVQGSNLVQEAH